MVNELAEIFDVVDTPAEAFEKQEKQPVDKRQVLRDAIRQQGKAHLLPKKCTEGFVDKAPDNKIEQTYDEFVQRELQEKRRKNW